MLTIAKKFLQFFKLVPTTSNVRDTLEELIEEESSSLGEDNHERTLLRNVLGLRDITAWDVMVPRADIAAIDVKNIKQLRNFVFSELNFLIISEIVT